jgi:hypothetical protein
MQNLLNAIALEVAFRKSFWFASCAHDTVTDEALKLRAQFMAHEVEELRTNSGLPVGTRDITAAMVCEAVSFKTNMIAAALKAPIALSSEYYLVRKGTPMMATNLRRYRYARLSAARAVANKMNGFAERESSKVEAVDRLTIMKRLRMVAVRNQRSGTLVLERNDTPWSCSVASDAYWQN